MVDTLLLLLFLEKLQNVAGCFFYRKNFEVNEVVKSILSTYFT